MRSASVPSKSAAAMAVRLWVWVLTQISADRPSAETLAVAFMGSIWA